MNPYVEPLTELRLAVPFGTLPVVVRDFAPFREGKPSGEPEVLTDLLRRRRVSHHLRRLVLRTLPLQSPGAKPKLAVPLEL